MIRYRLRLLSGFLAVILAISAGLPLAFEVLIHAGPGQDGAAHFEAQSVKHHADRCLLDTYSSNNQSALLFVSPALKSRVGVTEAARLRAPDLAPASFRYRPASRAPPLANG